MNAKLIRTIHPEIRVVDEAQGLVEYIASDETLDSYREVIRSKGWRFSAFEKNSPFVDSHDYGTIKNQVGRVVDFGVRKGQLHETVKWSIDVPENELAKFGFAMTKAGYLKAVSVGFRPVKMVSRWDSDPTAYVKQLEDLGLDKADDMEKPRTIYVQQEQIELSAVIVGANPNALAKAYKAGILDDKALDIFGREHEKREHALAANDPGDAARARRRARSRFLTRLELEINRL